LRKFKRGVLGKFIEIFIRRWAGPLIFCLLAWSVFVQLRAQPDLQGQLTRMSERFVGPNILYFLAAILLVIPNWGLEAMKWQLLMRGLADVRLRDAFRAVLAGAAFSLNTPNRIGEMGGRMLLVPEGLRLRSIPLTLVGGFAQLLVTLLAGMVAWWVIGANIIAEKLPVTLVPLFRLLPWAVLLFTIPSLFLYFRQGSAWDLMRSSKVLSRWQQYAEGLKAVDRQRAGQILGLSFLRFGVFALQYVLMLRGMEAGTDWGTGFLAVSVFYLLMAVVPSIALLELGLRWQYGIIIFGTFTENLVGVYAASTAIWLLNLLLPAVIGTFVAAGFRAKTGGKQIKKK
jgi:hypothetical protein